MRYKTILFITVAALILIDIVTTHGQEKSDIVFLPYIANRASTLPKATITPLVTIASTETSTPITTNTPTVTATFTTVSTPTYTPTPTQTTSNTALYLRWDLHNDRRYLDVEPHTDSINFVTALFPSAVVTYPYPLNGDIASNSYDFDLVLAIASHPSIPKALSIVFAIEILANDQILASTIFTSTSTTGERFSHTITGIDPSTHPGDTLILKIKNISDEGVGDVYMGKPPDFDSHITVPFAVHGESESTTTPTPIPTNQPTPTATDTATVLAPTNTPTTTPTVTNTQIPTDTPESTPEPLCLPQPGIWSGQTSEESRSVSFEVTADCTIHAFKITISSPGSIFICTITLTEDLPIINDRFSFNSSGIPEHIEITGEFQSQSTISGAHDIFLLTSCFADETGTWQAHPN